MPESTRLNLTPRFVQGQAMRIIGLSVHYTADTMDKIGEQWARFQPRLADVQGQIDAAQFGLHYPISDSPLAFDYVTGVTVAEAAPVPEGFVEKHVPARRNAVFAAEDGLSGLPSLLDGVFREWLPASGHQVAADPLFVEVYNPDFDPDAGKGTIEVWVPLKE